MSPHTFLWHDYETFGANTRRDRPAQFAAIRTDAELNEIADPVMLYCKPANDYLPDPQSCLITGITPQVAWERGVPEREFAARIEAEMARPGTVGVGYNTIRFDDEITRFMFWRNLIDPYAREWQNQCGRWDLLDVVRLAYALRPDGIVWPTKEDGTQSFKLEHLTQANGLQHEAAHDALSDVRRHHCAGAAAAPAQPPAVRLCLQPAQEGPRGGRVAPARHGADGAALFACFGHVQRRTRVPGRDVAAGQPPHQQERDHRLGPGARPA